MAETEIVWPKKTQEIQNRICDSTRWNDFKFRDGDIVIASFGKTGSTWTQQIVSQLIFNGQEGIIGAALSPWLDMRPIPFAIVRGILDSQQHRRFIKTHLPLHALVFSPKAKYIYVARDPRDVIWSGFNHISNFTEAGLAEFNANPSLGPPVGTAAKDPREFYLEFLSGDGTMGSGLWPMWEHFQGWWDARHLPNILLVHYANLKANLASEIERIARFLEIKIDERLMPQILAHCEIGYMRNTARSNPMTGDRLKETFKNGADTFFNQGTNGRWKDVLSAEEIARCDEVMAQKLTPDCAHWVKTGELPAGKK